MSKLIGLKSKINQKLVPIFLRAHGFFTYDGKPYPGKASPAYNVPNKFDDDDNLVFRETEFSEWMVDYISNALETLGYDYYRIPRNDDMNDVPLLERRSKVNEIQDIEKANGRYVWGIPIHVNASGMGGKWKQARGIAAFTYTGQSYSDIMAERFLSLWHEAFPDWYIFKDFRDGDSDLEAKFTVLSSTPWMVLLEVGFQDNKEDVALLLRRDIREKIGNIFIKWIITEIKTFSQR